MRPSCSTRLLSDSCSILVERCSPTVLLLRIEGHDVGEFGDLPMRCLEAFMPAELPVELFVDARGTRGATIDVSNDWATWLGRQHPRLSAIRMLAGSKYVHFTADFVRRFSGLEGTMHVYTSAEEFDEILAAAVPAARAA